MKKICFFLLIFFCTKSISAQTYYPMLDSVVNEWSYTTQVFGVRLASNTQSTNCTYPVTSYGPAFKEYTTSDTLIDSLMYKPVMNTYATCSMGYIREDVAARKVYFIDNLSPTEKLLYDFSMVVGDTMTINFIQNGGYVNGLYTLDSIVPVTIHAGVRNQFYLHCHSSPGSRVMTWIESVGNLNDMLYPYFDNDGSPAYYSTCPGIQHQFKQFLICFDHASKVYYDACSLSMSQNNPCCATYTDTCDYTSFLGGINEQNISYSWNIFPNPSSGKTTINIDVKQKDNFEIIIRDISGKKIMKEIAVGKLDEGKKDIDVDLASFANGFYLVELKTNQGSVYDKLLIQK